MGSVRTFFPTLVWQQRLSLPGGTRKFNEGLIQECRAFRELDEAGRRWSRKNYVEGYTSYSSVSDIHARSSRFETLKSRIDREVMKFVRHLEMDLQGRCLEISSFWINIMGRSAHHSFHLHPLSAISGTYYLQLPRDSGSFKIEDPRIACFMGSPPRKARAREENRRYVDIRCVPGEVLLFESWLKHEVPANRSAVEGPEGERISVSFNYDWM